MQLAVTFLIVKFFFQALEKMEDFEIINTSTKCARIYSGHHYLYRRAFRNREYKLTDAVLKESTVRPKSASSIGTLFGFVRSINKRYEKFLAKQ